MNLSINNTFSKNSIYNLPNYQNNQQRPAFTGKTQAAEDLMNKAMKEKSKFFKYFDDKYDKFTDFIADKFTSRVLESGALMKLANRFKNSENFYQHCLTVGSVITSGLYMQRTLANDKLDKDRKNTLAVNQGLTFIVSTIGAYALDKYVKGWWDNVTARFAGHLLGDGKFYENYLQQKQLINQENKSLKEAAKRLGQKPELKSVPKVTKLVEGHNYYKTLLKTSETDAKALLTKVKGMTPLRAMIVFGFVYRYFVPVVVTKPANLLCEKYLAYKKAKSDLSEKQSA